MGHFEPNVKYYHRVGNWMEKDLKDADLLIMDSLQSGG